MRAILRKFIVWILGHEPRKYDSWTCYIEDSHRSFELASDSFPSMKIMVPRVEPRLMRSDEPPDEAIIDCLVQTDADFENRVAFYRLVKTKPTPQPTATGGADE